ncbi:hypothetical protein [Pseudoclavibacter soli]|uniref:hypothetical protein n=1 Tax=Pseudoclavibacter soli TaxID=452623 RepID=UPI0004868DAF|nr:hypothetical protein [Pseudoclavibacter soli]
MSVFALIALVTVIPVTLKACNSSAAQTDAQQGASATAEVPTPDTDESPSADVFEGWQEDSDLEGAIPLDSSQWTRVEEARAAAASGFSSAQQRAAEIAVLAAVQYTSTETDEQRTQRLSRYFTADATGFEGEPTLKTRLHAREVGMHEEAYGWLDSPSSAFAQVTDYLGNGIPYAQVIVPVAYAAEITLVGDDTILRYPGSGVWSVWVPYYPEDGTLAVAIDGPRQDQVEI